jgi:hypothetical protein
MASSFFRPAAMRAYVLSSAPCETKAKPMSFDRRTI